MSEKRGVKRNVGSATAISNHGLEGDFHATGGVRQVSLLSKESIDSMRKKGLELKYGDFGENIVVEGIRVHELPVGSQIKISDAILEVSQIGKVCHTPCIIGKTIGDCIMPSEGVFAVIRKDGTINVGDEVRLLR